jgi:hypothetical protein
MNRVNKEDLFVIRMSLDTLLESVRQSEAWWRASGDSAALRRTQQLSSTVRATSQKFFADARDADIQIASALFVAEGLRDAARQCREGQGALQA